MSDTDWPNIRVRSNQQKKRGGAGSYRGQMSAEAVTVMPCGHRIRETARDASASTAEHAAEQAARRAGRNHATAHGCAR